MLQTTRFLGLLLAIALAVSASGYAQESKPLPRSTPPVATDGEGMVQALPRPPDLPASLFEPAPPTSPACDPLDVPYFVPDPLLDPPQLPPPGWFAGLEFDVLKPHVKNGLTNTVQNAAQAEVGTSTRVALPSAPLDWCFSPRVLLGYRLPAGFGEVALAYRGLGTRGAEGVTGPDGPARLNSRLDFNVVDLDYSSREFSLWPNWDLKWTVGLRTLFLFFDSQVDQPSIQAVSGRGIFQIRESNRLVGVGPHAGLELSRHLTDTGLSLLLRADFTTDLSRIHQGFFTLSTTPGPDGRPLAGETRVANWMDAPIINAQVGVSWQPGSNPSARFFLGYQYEYWWRTGGNVDTGARADLWDQGVVLQAAFRF
jgi:hypothetical protein